MAFIQTVLFFGMIRKNGLTNDHSLISSFIYITLTGFFPGMIILSPSSISFFILIFAIYNLFLTYDIEFPVQKFFFVSLYIGIGSLFYTPLCIFLLFMIVALPALKTPSLRELLIIIVGFLLPFYFLLLYFFMTDQVQVFYTMFVKSLPESINIRLEGNLLFLIPIVYALILFLASFLKYFFQSGSRTIRIIIYNRILITCIIFGVAAFILLPTHRWLMGPYILAPVSVYIGNMLADDGRKIFNQVVFSLLFLLAAYSEYIYYTL
jgi:hypothetical protein